MRELASAQRVDELIGQLARSIAERIDARAEPPWAMIGIKRRGDVLARRLAARLPGDPLAGRVGSLDITLYRDDLSEVGPQPLVRTSDIAFDLDGLNLVLIDDVLMTGRSVRAAIQNLMDFGRPARIWLAVLIDRGGRELPIQPDDTAIRLDPAGERGAALDLDPTDRVLVHLAPIDKTDRITLEPATNETRA